jgi:radical SAM protein with 4Fe4S-binding SPASM domain
MTGPCFVLELTHRCNLSCAYCYGPWKGSQGYPKGELRIDTLIELLDRLVEDAAPRTVTLIGGEPLLSDSFTDVARALSKRGVKVGLSTNGQLLDRGQVENLLRVGIGHFELSLDTLDRALYGKLTGGNLDDAIRAISALRSCEADCTLSVVLTRPVLPGLADLFGFAFAFGVKSVSLLRPVDCAGSPLASDLVPPREALVSALQVASELAAQTGILVTAGIPLEPCVFDRERFPNVQMASCGGATNKWAIDPMGNLRACEASPEIVGSLLESRFSELAHAPLAQRFRRANRRPDCEVCRWYEQCRGGCRQVGFQRWQP